MKLNLEDMSEKIFKKLIAQRGGRKTKRRKKRRKKKRKTYRKKKRKTRRNKRKRRKKTKRRRKRRQRGGVDLTFNPPNLTYQDPNAATRGAIHKNEQNKMALSKLQKGGRQKGGRQVQVKQMHSAGGPANASLNNTIKALLNARIDAKGDSAST